MFTSLFFFSLVSACFKGYCHRSSSRMTFWQRNTVCNPIIKVRIKISLKVYHCYYSLSHFSCNQNHTSLRIDSHFTDNYFQKGLTTITKLTFHDEKNPFNFTIHGNSQLTEISFTSLFEAQPDFIINTNIIVISIALSLAI